MGCRDYNGSLKVKYERPSPRPFKQGLRRDCQGPSRVHRTGQELPFEAVLDVSSALTF